MRKGDWRVRYSHSCRERFVFEQIASKMWWVERQGERSVRQVARSELSSTSWKQQLVVIQVQSGVRCLRKNSVEEKDERVKVEMFYLVNRCMIELLQQNFQRSQAISLFLS